MGSGGGETNAGVGFNCSTRRQGCLCTGIALPYYFLYSVVGQLRAFLVPSMPLSYKAHAEGRGGGGGFEGVQQPLIQVQNLQMGSSFLQNLSYRFS